MNKCKNCVHSKKNHGCKGYSDAKDDIGKGECNYCNCKQFIPQERKMSKEEMDLLYNKGEGLDYSFEENQGCGRYFNAGRSKCHTVNGLCPSCSLKDDTGSASPHSPTNLPSRRVKLGNREVAKDKGSEGTNRKKSSEITSKTSESDFILSDKMIRMGYDKDMYYEKDVAEFIRLVNKLSVADFLDCGVDKLSGSKLLNLNQKGTGK